MANEMNTERERSIRTDRESTSSSGVTRRQGTTPSSGYGSTGHPFFAMQRMAEDMDRLFDSFGFGRGLSQAWNPQIEAFRRGDKFVVRADLPGMKKDDVKVDVEDGLLTISGERCEENEDDRDDYYRSERSYGEFHRTIPLPEGVNSEQCDASFKDGVLEVTLAAPKEPERKSKRVQVR
jgi:HSP20 family protein